ncbi:MAG: redoxin family protein [Saprospiraceae bacterium]|nr:redoxin family protein [Saprospiraceae bacterium]
MRKFLLLLLFCFSLTLVNQLAAQLPNGATAQDWTATDLNGNSWNLYDLLEQGKPVVIDFSATWCGPCWNYHNSGVLEELYNEHGPNGSDEIMVFFLEADLSTNTACLYGPSGCVGGTQGNWVQGTLTQSSI